MYACVSTCACWFLEFGVSLSPYRHGSCVFGFGSSARADSTLSLCGRPFVMTNTSASLLLTLLRMMPKLIQVLLHLVRSGLASGMSASGEGSDPIAS